VKKIIFNFQNSVITGVRQLKLKTGKVEENNF